LALGAKRLAKAFGISERSVRSLDAAGKLPRPFRLGGRVVWPVSVIRRWLECGAPDRAEWERLERRRNG
jgi:predicted DNA-binding transcriptional regulator AlpA